MYAFTLGNVSNKKLKTEEVVNIKDKKRDALTMLINDINVERVLYTTGLPLQTVTYLKTNILRRSKMAVILIRNGFPIDKVASQTKIKKNILEVYYKK
jgi:hypothetical protein